MGPDPQSRSATTLNKSGPQLGSAPFMSRRHAHLSLRNGRGHLEDLGSSNGTFVWLRSTHPLASGDLIRLGDVLLRFEQS